MESGKSTCFRCYPSTRAKTQKISGRQFRGVSLSAVVAIWARFYVCRIASMNLTTLNRFKDKKSDRSRSTGENTPSPLSILHRARWNSIIGQLLTQPWTKKTARVYHRRCGRIETLKYFLRHLVHWFYWIAFPCSLQNCVAALWREAFTLQRMWFLC